MTFSVVLSSIVLMSLLIGSPSPASGQAVCNCSNTDSTMCSSQGFRITLVDFSTDQQAGTSSWDYEVCNEKGLGTGCQPAKDLSHIDFDLPQLGNCLTPSQDIHLLQLDGFAEILLGCSTSEKDPSCDIFGNPGSDFVAKCDIVDPSNLDPGECVTMRLTIAGEMPALGAGAAMTVTKAGLECAGDCILGPSCTACELQQPHECLTRTAGFWGSHPHISQQFLPVMVCGETLATTVAGSCNSVSEALCVSPGRESRRNRAYAQLVRQLAAAKLNIAATEANGGGCGLEIENRMAACEALCGSSQQTISASGCIEDLAAFNESQDTFPITPPPFDSPGPANPRQCKLGRGNGILIGASCR